MTTHQIVRFFVKYKYQAIFPIAVVEGPIITIISGFLVSRGRLSLIPALLVVFSGDAISDIIFYFIGRGGRRIMKYVPFLHVSDEQIVNMESRYHAHPWRTMLVSKFSYGLGTLFMIACGIFEMGVVDFATFALSLNFVRSSLLLALGYYFGKVAIRLGPTYLSYYALGIIIIVPLTTLFFWRKNKVLITKP